MALIDSFNRRVDYLRISVTDRCDLRCVYCMDEQMRFVPRAQLLTLEEITQIARAFTDLGVRKIRITGGEPLVRHGIDELLRQLGALKHSSDLRELTMTSNGTRLARYAHLLREAGFDRLNVSLDTLTPERFHRMTRVGQLQHTLDGLMAAKAAGFARIKLNCVILKNRNHDEINALVNFAIEHGFDISFIEEMPLGYQGDHDRAEAYYSSDEVMRDIRQQHSLLASAEQTGGPSRYYRVANTDTRVGFISPHSHNFCDSCNRVRLTATGRLLLCLGQEHSVSLRQVVREHPGNPERLQHAIVDAMQIKPRGHDFNLATQPIILRHMNTTGG